jgi:hypothetical protein
MAGLPDGHYTGSYIRYFIDNVEITYKYSTSEGYYIPEDPS